MRVVALVLYPSDPEACKAGGNVVIGWHTCLSLEMLEGGGGGLPVMDTGAIEFIHATLFVLPPGQSRWLVALFMASEYCGLFFMTLQPMPSWPRADMVYPCT